MAEPNQLYITPAQLRPCPTDFFLTAIYSEAKRHIEASRAFLYVGHSTVVPHRSAAVMTAFNDIFPNPNAFNLRRPENFSEMLECLRELDPFHGYEPPPNDRGISPFRLGEYYWTHDKRYVLILAAINTVILLQNAVMHDTTIFDTIDLIRPWVADLVDDFSFQRQSINVNHHECEYNTLHLHLDNYRELDQIIHRLDRDSFWPQIVAIVNRSNRSNVEHTHRDWTEHTWSRVEEMVSNDNKELKERICQMLESREFSESTVSAIFDVLMGNHMEMT